LEIRATFSGTGSESDVVRKYQRMPYMVLDDLGAEKMTDWSVSSLYVVLSGRYNANRPTIVTSNLTLAQIAEWEPRIASRLGGMCVVQLDGKDKRLAKAST
jgi:DNA replication protein DnaC